MLAAEVAGTRISEMVESGSWSSNVGDAVRSCRNRLEGLEGVEGRWIACREMVG